MKENTKPHFPQKLVHLLESRTSRRNAKMLLNLAIGTTVAIFFYTIMFHYLMSLEGKSYPLLTGLYWTFTTMTTLGLGDVFFESVTGQMYTILVLMSGVGFYLVLIPFILVRLFQSSIRIPRSVPSHLSGHVIITHLDAISDALIKKLNSYAIPYRLLVPNMDRATELLDNGFQVVFGHPEETETYEKLRLAHAAMLVSTAGDDLNTSITYAAREVSKKVPIICSATRESSRQVLRIAGATHVLEMHEMMGRSLARRVIGENATAHIIGQMEGLVVAESTVKGTPLSGKALKEADFPEKLGLLVVGVWKRGHFSPAGADTRITDQTALVLAGSREQIDSYNKMFSVYNCGTAPAIIIGGGRVGTAMGNALSERKTDYRLIELDPDSQGFVDAQHLIAGDATDRRVLEKAGIMQAPTVAITTHNDNVNIYLTTLCRFMRPDIHIISRATNERAIHLLHQAGADFIMSYASMGSNTIFNLLQSGNIMMVTEGVDIFSVPTPNDLVNKSIATTNFRKITGCSIIGLKNNGSIKVNPAPDTRLEKGNELILIGTVESEKLFLEKYNIPAPQKS